jgi:hypothetical protein
LRKLSGAANKLRFPAQNVAVRDVHPIGPYASLDFVGPGPDPIRLGIVHQDTAKAIGNRFPAQLRCKSMQVAPLQIDILGPLRNRWRNVFADRHRL